MIIEPPKTMKEFLDIKESILELMNNKWIDSSIYNSLKEKLDRVNSEIDKLS